MATNDRNDSLMADLYGVAVPKINEHMSNIFDDEELQPEATIRKFRIVQTKANQYYDQFAEKRRNNKTANPQNREK